MTTSNQQAVQAVVVPATTSKNQRPMQISLSNTDGSVASTIKKQGAQADSVASTVAGVVTDFNALLAKLRAAGVLS